MTCREFEHAMASRTLRTMSQAPDETIAIHAAECSQCETWLQERRMLAGAMQGISLKTGGLQASPRVEAALLQTFRQQRKPEAVRSTPVAMRLSRWFEIGAYAAVAAACLIAIFLGYRVWQDHKVTPVESRNVPAITQPAAVNSPVATQPTVAVGATNSDREAGSLLASRRAAKSAATAKNSQSALNDETLAQAGYTDLMFCDPLSCSSDAQVVRMELPVQGAADASGAQTVVADVVVGDDGLVRAVRIVN